MSDTTQDLLKVAAEYVAVTQPLIEESERQQAVTVQKTAAWTSELSKTAGVLRAHGLLDPERTDEFIEKAAQDPTVALHYLGKLAQSLDPNGDMGGTGAIKLQSAESVDPFVKHFFPERLTH